MDNVKILGVTGYYQEGNNFEFVEGKSWKGEVILREDLTFEGIVIDQYSDITTDDRFISGTLVEYNGASLMKFSNHGLCPCSFFGMSTGKEIIGSWAVHDYVFTVDKGRCKIIFTELPEDDSTVSDILRKIETFKSNMDEFSKELYNSLIENMSATVENFLDNMEQSKEKIEKEIGYPLKKLEI